MPSVGYLNQLKSATRTSHNRAHVTSLSGRLPLRKAVNLLGSFRNRCSIVAEVVKTFGILSDHSHYESLDDFRYKN